MQGNSTRCIHGHWQHSYNVELGRHKAFQVGEIYAEHLGNCASHAFVTPRFSLLDFFPLRDLAPIFLKLIGFSLDLCWMMVIN